MKAQKEYKQQRKIVIIKYRWRDNKNENKVRNIQK
jgi:hypothetical protein